MAKPTEYQVVETHDINEARKLISFPVARKQIAWLDESGPIEMKREVIVREDNKLAFEVLSKGYRFVKHEDAFDAAILGLQNLGVAFELKQISLDRGGARMYARFQFEKTYPIIKGVDLPGGLDLVQPELTLNNSYDGDLSLGFDLGSLRRVCMNLAQAKVMDVRARFMHLGNSASPEKLQSAAQEAIKTFEERIVPLYKKMADHEISKDLATRAVVAALLKGVLPVKLGRFAIHCVTSEKAFEREKNLKRSAWTLFNAFSWILTHKFVDGSPSRSKELQQKLATAFRDGGVQLLKSAEKVTQKEISQCLEDAEKVA